MADSEFVLTLEGQKELLAKIERLPSSVREEVGQRTLLQGAILLEGYIKGQKLSGQVLHVRSGRLRASMAHQVAQEGQDLVARIGPHVVYARILELGGTITARNARNLTIPVGPALTPSGVPRYTARDLISNPSLGGFKRTFFRNKKLYGVTRGGRAVVVFVLKPSITIKEYRYMRSSLAEKAQEIIALIAAAVERALKRL